MSAEPLLSLVGDGELKTKLTALAGENPRWMVRQEVQACGGCVDRGTTSLVTCVCLLVQSIMGGGLLAYPHAFLVGGVLNMILLQLLLMVFIALGLWVLAWCTEVSGADTYQAMVRVLLGRRAEMLCVAAILTLIFGASVVYLDVCVDQLHPWLLEQHGLCLSSRPGSVACWISSTGLADRSFLTLIVAIALSLLCLGRSMASLAVPSLIGFGALVYVCFIIIGNYVASSGGDSHDMGAVGLKSPLPMAHGLQAGVDSAAAGVVWWRIGADHWLSLIPVICFSYQGHISAVPLYAELRYRSPTRWLKVIMMGLTACVLLYNAAGLLGYMQFLEETQGDILQSFAQPGALYIPTEFVTVARAAVVIAVSVTSAVLTFCSRGALLGELSGLWGERLESYGAFLTVTYCWVAAVAVTAVFVPKMGAMISVVGNFSAFFMFLFPGLCLVVAAKGDKSDCAQERPQSEAVPKLPMSRGVQLALGWAFVVLGVVVFVLGMSNALLSL